jgi:FemAB-related protein (PEP-CTERM system-associated)
MALIHRLRFEDEADFDRWQEYVAARPDSHCSDLAEWRLLFRELYGFENHSWLCSEDGRIAGALSLYHIRSPFLGRMLVSCPFFGYGGFYWETDSAREALLERAERTARRLRVDYLELRLLQQLPPPFQANTDFAEYRLELGATPEETWSQALASNVRQNIRKARKTDLEFRLSADHASCYDLLRRTLRAHGTPFHGERFFLLLKKQLERHLRFSEVWQGEQLVAAGVVLAHQRTMITPYIGSLAGSRALRANYLQYWGLIEHGSRVGVRCFDMGRSPRGSTHARFKAKWGCNEVQAFYNYRMIDARKEYRSVSQPSATQRLATRIWRRLPLAVTTALGPRLFRYIP